MSNWLNKIVRMVIFFAAILLPFVAASRWGYMSIKGEYAEFLKLFQEEYESWKKEFEKVFDNVQ